MDPVVVGPYTLVAPLAQGGMGAVHFAVRNESVEKRPLLLIKTLKSSLIEVADYAGRFNDEAKVALRLRHKNLCEVFDAGEDKGTFYLAMELIEGVTFKRMHALLDQHKRKLTTTEAVALGVSLLRGLHAAHMTVDDDGKPLGVVHRDVSPHNTMLDKNGRVKVIDYGLATSVLKETFTESMVALGKAGYIAPEQARGEDVSQASDQYSAAIVVYELLSGDRYYGELNSRSIWAIAGSGVHKPRSWERVPEELRAPLQRALSSKAALRFESCDAFADALVAIEPRAADSEKLASLRTLVADLAPPELLAADDARVIVERLEEVTERTPTIIDGRTVEATQIVRTRKSSDEDTASTIVRSVARPSAPVVAARRPRTTLVAAAGVVVGAAVVAVAVAGFAFAPSSASAPVSTTATTATATTTTTTTTTTTATTTSASVAASAAGASTTAGVPIANSVDAHAAPVVARDGDAARRAEERHRERLARAADAFLAKNPDCPIAIVVRNARKKIAHVDLGTFESTLKQAEQQCPSG